MKTSEIHQLGKRLVVAPHTEPLTSSGTFISVWLQPDEKVEWIWTINSDGSRRVTGYRIVKTAIA